MKLLIPASLALVISQFTNELHEGAIQLIALTQLPGMHLVFSAVALPLAIGLLKVLPVLRS